MTGLQQQRNLEARPLQISYLIKFLLTLQERLSHGISASGFPGNHRAADFQHHHPYFPPHFPTGVSQHQTAQDFVAAQNAHLAATDPYNVNSLHHSFQTTQVFIYQA